MNYLKKLLFFNIIYNNHLALQTLTTSYKLFVMSAIPVIPVLPEHDFDCPNNPDVENQLEALPSRPPPLVRQVAELIDLPPIPSVCPACYAINNPSS
jgi:hypothetical protein